MFDVALFVRRYNIPWPSSMAGLLAAFRLALMDVYQVTAVDCYAEFNFYTPFYFTTIATTVMLLSIPILHRSVPWILRYERNVNCLLVVF